MGFRVPLLVAVPAAGLIAVAVLTADRLPPPPDDPPPRGLSADGMTARSVAYERVGREYLAGRLSLPEAAAAYGWLNALHPPLWPTAAGEPPAGLARGPNEWTPDERSLLHVIRRVEALVEHDEPARRESVRAALAAEFEAGRSRPLPAVCEGWCWRLLADAATGRPVSP